MSALRWESSTSEHEVHCRQCGAERAAAECVHARLGLHVIYVCREDCQEEFEQRYPGACAGARVVHWRHGDGPLTSEPVGEPFSLPSQAVAEAKRLTRETGRVHWAESL